MHIVAPKKASCNKERLPNFDQECASDALTILSLELMQIGMKDEVLGSIEDILRNTHSHNMVVEPPLFPWSLVHLITTITRTQ